MNKRGTKILLWQLCNIIALIIWIMDKNNIRMHFFQGIYLVICNRYILWKLISFIMNLYLIVPLIHIIIRYRHYYYMAVFISHSCSVNTVKRVPHRCLVWQENNFIRTVLYVFFHTFFYLF